MSHNWHHQSMLSHQHTGISPDGVAVNFRFDIFFVTLQQLGSFVTMADGAQIT